eukprot:13144355-Alexandrium_andersonii.AAC.1
MSVRDCRVPRGDVQPMRANAGSPEDVGDVLQEALAEGELAVGLLLEPPGGRWQPRPTGPR